jgi:hypothetical protein
MAAAKKRAPARSRRLPRKTGSAKPATAAAATAVRLPRIAKGKRPQYFSDPAIDKLLWMTMTLMEELSVARDRIDTLERVLTRRRVLRATDIEEFVPDARAAEERATRRASSARRRPRAVHAELEEITAKGDPTSEAIRAVEE